MISILDPAVDADIIAAVLAPESGYRFVDGWVTALPELATLDRPSACGRGLDPDRYAATAWPPDIRDRMSRYIVYPWRRTVVKLPESHYFRWLRSARNRYLIDRDEQTVWTGALIGIAGLSIGASVLSACALTGAGRFRLADTDVLGPTNLNRLPASVCDLGVTKLELAQRRTLELDPYTEITAVAEGYSPESAPRFLGTGPDREPLAVLLEEMDDFAMKVDIRLRARRARIPVLMVTDHGDNVILDIERYDLDAEYPLFHGRAGDLGETTAARLSDPRTRARLANLIVGPEVTPRTRFSLTQVGQSLPSWPQLGTAATAAGAFGALAARLLVTGAELPSGRYRLDLDAAILGAAARRSDRWNELSEAEFTALMAPPH
ncbi:ThiF family adenylyltransferase [Nocardia sp. NPDC046763]|uniref:ThiF family adenylyltransferase n=1 Tax=Nocardia sp. NPDC046763 TaxID=3155256 RepID=UPI0033F541F6